MNNEDMRFEPFPKVPRLSRPVVITEKIDGTNASVTIITSEQVSLLTPDGAAVLDEMGIFSPARDSWLMAASRKRWIKPGNDNFAFAHWAWDNYAELIEGLGEGTHYGEWWGSGIQRGYGLPKGEKRFSLFNTGRWRKDGAKFGGLASADELCPECCHVVPILAMADGLSEEGADRVIDVLRDHGSYATPFMDPEGIMMYHRHSNQYFKKTIKDDAEGKEHGA